MSGDIFAERLSATDASFLRIETEHEPQHVGSLSILDGASLRSDDGRLRFDDLMAHVARRLHRVPRLRQRLREVPLAQGRPVWVDDDHFDLGFHVRLTALPRPGDDEQLGTLMGRLQSLPLDRSRPLWEMWFVDGLDNDDVALIIKTHHALGDGIANVDLALALVDITAEIPDDGDDPPPWTPRPAPSSEQLLADSFTDQTKRLFQSVRAAARSLRDPGPALRAGSNVVRTVLTFASKPDEAPWNRDVSPHRRWVHADIPIDAIHAVRAERAATFNDVVLTACTGALRSFLAEHGDDVDTRTLKAMVPVSNRADDEHGDTLGNKISMMVVELPVYEADRLTRLEVISASTRALKGSGMTDGTERIVKLADSVAPLAAPLTRLISKQIPMNLVITNIPGPPLPLYLYGARVQRTYPYVEVIDHEGLSIAVISYDGQLFFGLTSDRDVIPDLADLARALEVEFDLLVADAQST